MMDILRFDTQFRQWRAVAGGRGDSLGARQRLQHLWEVCLAFGSRLEMTSLAFASRDDVDPSPFGMLSLSWLSLSPVRALRGLPPSIGELHHEEANFKRGGG